MTRINLISPEFLSDQHLLAEYRELPRIINSYKCNLYNPNKNFYKNIPTKYKLGTGHVKFFRNKIKFLLDRYKLLVKELLYRGFNISYYSEGVYNDLINIVMLDDNQIKEFTPSEEEIRISQERIKEKLSIKPEWYKWTKRHSFMSMNEIV